MPELEPLLVLGIGVLAAAMLIAATRIVRSSRERARIPSSQEIRALLRKHNALIVHFSGPQGSSNSWDPGFPQNLEKVISGGAMGGVSCSTVSPSDAADAYWGDVGVVLSPSAPASLYAAFHRDCGSYLEDQNGRQVRLAVDGLNPTIASVEHSIIFKSSHNELILRDYEILGLFVYMPAISMNKFSELRLIFPDQPIYVFKMSEIYEISSGNPTAALHSEIYATS